MPCKAGRPPTQRFISMCMEKARSLAHPFFRTACLAAGHGSVSLFKTDALATYKLLDCRTSQRHSGRTFHVHPPSGAAS